MRLLAFASVLGALTLTTEALAFSGRTCVSDDGTDRAACVAMIGAIRETTGFNRQRSQCLPDGNHMAPPTP